MAGFERSLLNDQGKRGPPRAQLQEMITHLPLASHRNPKEVLVAGGSTEASWARSSLKHDSVEHVLLGDIDEISPRMPVFHVH